MSIGFQEFLGQFSLTHLKAEISTQPIFFSDNQNMTFVVELAKTTKLFWNSLCFALKHTFAISTHSI